MRSVLCLQISLARILSNEFSQFIYIPEGSSRYRTKSPHQPFEDLLTAKYGAQPVI